MYPNSIYFGFKVFPHIGTLGPKYTVNPIKLETGLRPNGAGIPYT